MKPESQLRQELSDIITKINEYAEKMVDAMCNGEEHKERRYSQEISDLEYKKSIFEYVLS